MKREKTISPKKRTFIDLFRIYGSGAMLAIIILVICYQFVEPAPPLNFTIATGSKSGVYYSTALEYQKILAKQGITLNIIESKGSEENLELLATGKSEVAFVQAAQAVPSNTLTSRVLLHYISNHCLSLFAGAMLPVPLTR